jgi:hypothetical protein
MSVKPTGSSTGEKQHSVGQPYPWALIDKESPITGLVRNGRDDEDVGDGIEREGESDPDGDDDHCLSQTVLGYASDLNQVPENEQSGYHWHDSEDRDPHGKWTKKEVSCESKSCCDEVHSEKQHEDPWQTAHTSFLQTS